jgi:hypothetical protein
VILRAGSLACVRSSIHARAGCDMEGGVLDCGGCTSRAGHSAWAYSETGVAQSGLVLSTIGYVLTRLVRLLRCTSALVYIGINAMGASSVKSSNT